MVELLLGDLVVYRHGDQIEIETGHIRHNPVHTGKATETHPVLWFQAPGLESPGQPFYSLPNLGVAGAGFVPANKKGSLREAQASSFE